MSTTMTSMSTMKNRYKVSKPKVTKPRTTLEEKIMILNHYHRSNKAQADTVEFFKDRYSISTSSFSEWLKDEETLRDLYNNSNEFLKKSKRKLRFKYDKINEEMDKLVEKRLKENSGPINEPFLRENWAIFAQKYGVDDPKRLLSFSHGWLSQFKKRHGLDKQSRLMKLNANNNNNSNVELNMIKTESNEDNTNLKIEIDDDSSSSTTGSEGINNNFLNMEINEDYINLQTNINTYESLINTSTTSTPNYSQIPNVINDNNYTTTRYNNSINNTPTFNTFEINYEVINEGDFETFLNKYGDEFLNLNQDKYPESLKILCELRQIFKKEKELSNDKKLRELLFRR